MVQFDAHLDWTGSVGLHLYGNGSPMRRLSEMDYIKLRGIGSSRREDFEDAKSWGNVLIISREARRIAPEGAPARIHKSDCYYVNMDIDGMDYDEVDDRLAGICWMGKAVGFDLVEVVPQYDPAGITSRLAVMTMFNMMAQIMKNKN